MEGRRLWGTQQAGELGAALGTLASASAAPYGFTLSVWSSGAILTHFRGAPNVGDVFLFIAGALAGFALVGFLAHRPLRAPQYAVHGERERVLAGLLHWFAVGIAVGSVVLISQIPSWVAWPLSMFTGDVSLSAGRGFATHRGLGLAALKFRP